MDVIKRSSVLLKGASGDADDTLLYRFTVLKIGHEFKAYYSAYDGTSYRIFSADSVDGVYWRKAGVIKVGGAVGSIDERNPGRYGLCAVLVGCEVWLYYSADDIATTQQRTALLISQDGVNFTSERGVVLAVGSGGDIDDRIAYAAYVAPLDREFICYYCGYNTSSTGQICVANSVDGLNWIKKGVVIPRTTGSVDTDPGENGITGITTSKGAVLFYSGSSNIFSYAVSQDFYNFSQRGGFLFLGSAGDTDDLGIQAPAALQVGRDIYLYYLATPGASDWRVNLAVIKKGMSLI